MASRAAALSLCTLLTTLLPVSAIAQQIERPLELKYEFEDDLLVENKPVKITITVINNSDEEKRVRLYGIVRYMAIGVNYNSDALLEHPIIAPHEVYVYNFSQQFVAGPWSMELRLGEPVGTNTLVNNTGASFQFVVQPAQDVYLRESAEYDRLTAAGTIGAALAAVGAVIYTIFHDRRTLGQMRTQTVATQGQLRSMREQNRVLQQELYDEQYARWETKYYEHSKHIAETIVDWIEGIFIPYTGSYRNGELDLPDIREPMTLPLLDEAKKHLEKEFSGVPVLLEEIKLEAIRLSEKLKQNISSFEKAVIEKVETECLDLTEKNDELAEPGYSRRLLLKTIFLGVENRIKGNAQFTILQSEGIGGVDLHCGPEIVGFGSKDQMAKLEKTIRDLLGSYEIFKLVYEFDKINKELTTNADRKTIQLLEHARYIQGRVTKGLSMVGSYGVCEHCPPKPVPPPVDEENPPS